LKPGVLPPSNNPCCAQADAAQAAVSLETLEAALPADMLDERRARAGGARRRLLDCRQQLSGGMEELEIQPSHQQSGASAV
jgi:hypothetical protein